MKAFLGKANFIDPAQIDAAIAFMKTRSEAEGILAVLIGGVAMQAYGCPRLTRDVDFALDRPLSNVTPMNVLGPINFGGTAYRFPEGTRLNLVVRDDEYKALYEEAVANAATTDDQITKGGSLHPKETTDTKRAYVAQRPTTKNE